jgi:hypothetical protein
MNEEYIPTPTRKATRLVVQTPRRRIILISTSGSRARVSTTTHAVSRTTPRTMSASVFGEVQPQVVVSLVAIRTAVSPSDIRIAARLFTCPGTLTGDSGTNT